MRRHRLRRNKLRPQNENILTAPPAPTKDTMKTAKSIIVILFVLLTAQIASAYYCPSTGRWLSRDPISEPGFQALQTASSPSGMGNSVLKTSGRWVNRDGNGEPSSKAYGFINNNAITGYDILGLSPNCCCNAKTVADGYKILKDR
jgi:hypothetical protein